LNVLSFKNYDLPFIHKCLCNIPGSKGGINFKKTFLKLRIFRFLIDVARLPVKKYNMVLCDFEPVAAWACRLKGRKCIGLSHQNAVLHPNAPNPAEKN
jgi:hypothetical protein